MKTNYIKFNINGEHRQKHKKRFFQDAVRFEEKERRMRTKVFGLWDLDLRKEKLLVHVFVLLVALNSDDEIAVWCGLTAP